MKRFIRATVMGLVLASAAVASAEIYNWQTGELIPGTEGVWPGPAADLHQWDFSFGDFRGSDLNWARFDGSLLGDANFTGANLTNTYFPDATLAGATLADAQVARADFRYTTQYGFAKEQLYSTASYKAGNLTGINLGNNDLTGWNFAGQNVSGADFQYTTLAGADFTNAVIAGAAFGPSVYQSHINLSKEQLYSTASYQAKDLSSLRLFGFDLRQWNFAGQNLTGAYFWDCPLTDADFTDAIVPGASFYSFFKGGGLTQAQLYSTASYKAKNLAGITLSRDLSNWNFAEQNLAGADFHISTLTGANLSGADLTGTGFARATLTGTNFTDAVVANANFYQATSRGFTKEQLYSTASYKAKDLTGIKLIENNLASWNFAGQNLTDADFSRANLAGADLTDAVVLGAHFTYITWGTASPRFTKEQLYSTASYKAKDLSGIGLAGNNLTNWDFAGQNLTGADFTDSTLSGVNLAGACVRGARFNYTTDRGFTKEQLYSTASYAAKDLAGIGLMGNNLAGWNFAEQDLTGADFGYIADLAGADLTDAIIKRARFYDTTRFGFTQEQLYSTASYKAKDLEAITMGCNDMTGWNFAGQNLAGAYFGDDTLVGANFEGANLQGADLRRADLRGATLTGADLTGANTQNSILPDGTITGLNLQIGDILVIRNGGRVTVHDEMVVEPGATIGLRLETSWDSTITVDLAETAPMTLGDAPVLISLAGVLEEAGGGPSVAYAAAGTGATLDLGGTLDLRFANGVDPNQLVGQTYDLFDWKETLGAEHFDQITTTPGFQWDLSDLYVGGTVKLTVTPEPATLALLGLGGLGVLLRRKRR